MDLIGTSATVVAKKRSTRRRPFWNPAETHAVRTWRTGSLGMALGASFPPPRPHRPLTVRAAARSTARTFFSLARSRGKRGIGLVVPALAPDFLLQRGASLGGSFLGDCRHGWNGGFDARLVLRDEVVAVGRQLRCAPSRRPCPSKRRRRRWPPARTRSPRSAASFEGSSVHVTRSPPKRVPSPVIFAVGGIAPTMPPRTDLSGGETMKIVRDR